MKRPYGITFEIGCASVDGKRKWFVYLGWLKLRKMRPSLDGMDATHGGLKFDIMIGSWRRPIPRINLGFLKRPFVKTEADIAKWEAEHNPWNSGKHWKVVPKWVVLPFFFLSLSYGAGERQVGFYFGCKSYEVNRVSQNRAIWYEDGSWEYLPRNAWGEEEEKGNIYLALSASLREDLVD
ncbi:hypothetical protein ACFL3R_00630 [Thermodesulfobacteriota bacterium]